MTVRREIIDRSRQAKKKRFRRHILLFGIVFLFLISFAVYAFNYERFLIKGVQVSGARALTETQIVDLTNEVLAGRYAWLVSRRNRFIYPEEFLISELKRVFPRIAKVAVALDASDNLAITLEERTTKFLWCESANSERQCFFLDEDGWLFAPAPQFAGETLITFSRAATSSQPIIVGTPPLPSEQFRLITESLQTIARALDDSPLASFRPRELVLGEAGDYQLWFESRAWPATPFVIHFNLSKTTIPEVLVNLRSALQAPEFREKLTAGQSTLEYLDLRFSRKVFYRFR